MVVQGRTSRRVALYPRVIEHNPAGAPREEEEEEEYIRLALKGEGEEDTGGGAAVVAVATSAATRRSLSVRRASDKRASVRGAGLRKSTPAGWSVRLSDTLFYPTDRPVNVLFLSIVCSFCDVVVDYLVILGCWTADHAPCSMLTWLTRELQLQVYKQFRREAATV